MNKKKLLSLALLFNFVILQSHLPTIMAQTTDEDVAESERQKTIAENKKAEQDALFPKPDAASLVGTTVASGDFIEARMLGYCAMKTAAGKIVKSVVPVLDRTTTSTTTTREQAKPTLIVYSEDDAKMLSRYSLMMNRLGLLEKGYTEVLGNQPQSLDPGLIINTVLNYLSLLKTDLKITGTEFNIGEKELVAEVFSKLQAENKGYVLYYPKTIPLSVAFCQKDSITECSPLLQKIVNVVNLYVNAAELELNAGTQKRKIIQRDQLNKIFFSTMKELGLPSDPPKKPDATPTPTQTPTPVPSQNTQTTTVSVNTAEKKEESGGGNSTFISYLQGEALYNVMKEERTYWIDMQVIKAGGNMRIKTNFITNFFIGARVNFSGGALVYFNVFNNQGVSQASGVIESYRKYRKSSQINSTCNKED